MSPPAVSSSSHPFTSSSPSLSWWDSLVTTGTLNTSSKTRVSMTTIWASALYSDENVNWTGKLRAHLHLSIPQASLDCELIMSVIKEDWSLGLLRICKVIWICCEKFSPWIQEKYHLHWHNMMSCTVCTMRNRDSIKIPWRLDFFKAYYTLQ